MKIVRLFAAAGLAAAVLSFGPSQAAQAEVTFQLGHPTASTSHYGVAAVTFADEMASSLSDWDLQSSVPGDGNKTSGEP